MKAAVVAGFGMLLFGCTGEAPVQEGSPAGAGGGSAVGTGSTPSGETNVPAQKAPCTDSDGGKDAMVFGTVAKGDVQETDFCFGNNTVQERHCDNNQIAADIIICPERTECRDGACVPAE